MKITFTLLAFLFSYSVSANEAGWTQKESWVSRLSHQETQRMMGLEIPPDLTLEFGVEDGPANLPPAMDWRNKDGVNWISPILNQGNCGSCVAFASVATLESQVNIDSGVPGLNPTFSTQALFACGGGSCDRGWFPELAALFLKYKGVPDESCLPYTSGATGVDVSCHSACPDSKARRFKISGFSHPTWVFKNRNAVKKALLHGPLVTTMRVYTDFLSYGSGVYQHHTGSLEGGHAVSLIGYDDTKQAWLIRNSWSTDWGMNGFAWVSYNDVSGIGNTTIAYRTAPQEGYVSLENPHGRTFQTGVIHLQGKSTFANTAAVQFHVLTGNGASALIAGCKGIDCMAEVNTRGLSDGAYEVYATARDGDRKVLGQSQHEQLYVVNTSHPLSISFSGVDFSKPLRGRPVFQVSTSTGINEVPLSELTFHAVKDGTEIFKRSSEIVLPKMTMGWRTNTGPNGAYEIFFTGELKTADGKGVSVESAHQKIEVKN